MRKFYLFIILINLITFNFTLANEHKKIFVEDVENIFFQEYLDIFDNFEGKHKEASSIEIELLKTSLKRQKNRGMAKCIYENIGQKDYRKKCAAKVIHYLNRNSEIVKKRKPGNVFYILDAVTELLPGEKLYLLKINEIGTDQELKVTKIKQEGIKCAYRNYVYYCPEFKKSFNKKLIKFKKDPTNEKVLGKKVTKYIKNLKTLNYLSQTIGNNEKKIHPEFVSFANVIENAPSNKQLITSNYSLIGDMLNESVSSVKKNKLSSELTKRIKLLKKYKKIINKIKIQIDDGKFKKLNFDISNLSKSYNNLVSLTNDNSNTIINNFDTSISILSNINNLILVNIKDVKSNIDAKKITIASIEFMQFYLDLILEKLPDEFIVETKTINKEFYSSYDLEKIELFIQNMQIQNNNTKQRKFSENKEIINQYIKVSEVIKNLEDLEIIYKPKKDLTFNSFSKLVENNLENNLNDELFKDIDIILEELNKNELSEINEELAKITTQANEISKEVANDQQTKSFLDRKVGNFTMKQLIGAHRKGYIDLGIGNR